MSDTLDVVYPDFSPDDAFATFGLAKYLRFTAKAFPANNFTITFWWQPKDSGTILYYGNPDGASSFNSLNTTMEVRQNGGFLEIEFKTASQNSSTISIEVTGPHFIALRFSQTADQATVQVNIDNNNPQIFVIQLINSLQQPVTLPAGDMLCIGTRTPDNEGHVSFNDLYNGTITDLRVWKHLMTEAEILEDSFREVYGDENDLCLALPLDADNINIDINTADNLVGDVDDDPQFTHVVDAPGWVVVDQFPMPANTMTLEWWMRCGVNDYGYIVNYDDISNSEHPNDASNNLIISYSGGIQINNRATGINFTDGEWHHIALVFTDTTQAYFLDGFQVGTTQPRSFDALLTPRKLIMGIQSTDVNDYAFSGQIQRFFTWNTALSSDEVLNRALLTDITTTQQINIVAALPLTSATIINIPSTSYASSQGLLLKKDVLPLSDGINWFKDQKIFSRTALTDEFTLNGANQIVTQSVYRISVSCSTLVQTLKISASEAIIVTINDTLTVLIGPGAVASVTPNIYGKTQISFPAVDTHCPIILVQTDLMDPLVYHYIFPDIEVYKKLVNLPAGTLSNPINKAALNIDSNLTTAQIDNFQTAIQNISATVQHTYNRTKHSITHDRKVLPLNMLDAHFKFDFGSSTNKTYTYQALQKSEVQAAVGNAQKMNISIQQCFYADAIDKLRRAESIFVHTIENIGGTIVDGADHIGKDVVGAVQQIGEDITHGDLLYAAQDLIRGGENLASDLTRTSAGIVTNAVQGAGQLFAITLQLGEDMYQYFIAHSNDVGRIISALFQKISSSIDTVINWIKDKLPTADILNTYNALLSYFNTGFTNSSTLLNTLKQNLNDYLDGLTTGLQTSVDQMMKGYSMASLASSKSTHPAHSMAMEKAEWLLGKIHRSGGTGTTLQLPEGSTTQNANIDAIYNAITNQYGAEGEKLASLFDKSQLSDYFTLIASGTNDANYIISGFWKLVQSLITAGMSMAKTIIDKIIDLVIDMLTTIKNALQSTANLGIVNNIFTFFTGDNSMSIMKLGVFLVSIPLTMYAKSAYGSPPFETITTADRNETMLLSTPLPRSATDYATVYGILHLSLAPISLISDIKALVNIAGDATVPQGALTGWVNKMNGNTMQTAGYSDQVIAVLGAFLSVGAQFIGNPVPPNNPYALPLQSEKDDPHTAPNYYAHVIWIYQWFGWGGHNIPTFINLGLLKYPVPQKIISFAIPIYDTLFGAFHIYLMTALDAADRGRIKALCLDKDAGRTLSADAVAYLNWATEDNTITIWNSQTSTLTIPVPSPLSRKTFGNICDCIPEISQLGLLPIFIRWTKGYSLLGTMLLDTFGQIGEGATVLVRTKNNELY